MTDLDAIVIAETPRAGVRIAGLTAVERACRVATKVGATRTFVIDRADARAELVAWRTGRSAPVLVIAADQLVHTPLVTPLIERPLATAIAVVPDPVALGDRMTADLPAGAYAGALIATGAAADDVVTALARGDADRAIAERLPAAVRIPHGAIARAPIETAAQLRAAQRLLYQILVKPQDNAITRYLYRPVSFPLTRLLVWTPITPNQISYLVAAMVAIGCWVTAHASMNAAIAGTAIVLAASYLDCCDGEVARVKLLSSRFGAWIDTVVDELSSVGYMVALGWHCHLAFGPRYFGALPFDPWQAAIAVSVVTFLWSIYCIYYNIIVAVGSANSQDYVGRFEIVPGDRPNSVRLQPAAKASPRRIGRPIGTPREQPRWLRWLATYMPYVVRRDFISWASLVLAVVHWTHVTFGCLVIGGVITFVIVTIDHFKLRALRRAIARDGLMLEPR